MDKLYIIDEQDINTLIKEALKYKRELTFPNEASQMLINLKGVCINGSPRSDGRYQGYLIIDGKKNYFYGKTREEVAEKIRQRLKKPLVQQKKEGRTPKNATPATFTAFALYHFENFRKKKIAQLTYKADISRLKNYLLPTFKEIPLKSITPKDCQSLLDTLKAQNKHKTAEEIYSLMSIIFKSALNHGIIARSPLTVVYFEKHERQHGKALTLKEECLFKAQIRLISNERVVNSLFLMLYTGLRPNELKTAKIDNGFVVAVNSKRHNKKIEYKRIPIINALKPYINRIDVPNLDLLRRTIKEVLPNHKLYDLRTTFYTRCKEYGVSDFARDFFVGHSAGVLADTYTDFSDEYLKKEAEKLNAWN